MKDSLTAALNYIRTFNPFQLARIADCGSPDSEDSPGASMLAGVLSSFTEAVEYAADAWPEYGPTEMAEHIRDDDAGHEAADSAPSVYTYDMWKQFVDLAAWQEDPSEIGADETRDMEKMGSACLYLIARRLWDALAEALAEFEDDSEDDSE